MSFNTTHYLIGYGSLISHDSRYRFSNIESPNIPVVVEGWRREWLARGYADKQTGLGVSKLESASLNGLLLPIDELSDDLKTREQDYEFVPVDVAKITAACDSSLASEVLKDIKENIGGTKIWICSNLHSNPADSHFPIHQTYLDTCLLGCLEVGREAFAIRFLQSTHYWQDGWINDRLNPRYVRAAKVNIEQQQGIDKLLADLDLLQYRQG